MDEQAYGQSTPLASCIFLQHKLKIGEGVSSAVFSRTDPCTCAHFDTEPCTCAHFDRGGNIEGGPINGACSQHLPRDGRTPQRTPQAHRRAHISISIYHSSQTLSATQSAQDASISHQAQDASLRHRMQASGISLRCQGECTSIRNPRGGPQCAGFRRSCRQQMRLHPVMPAP